MINKWTILRIVSYAAIFWLAGYGFRDWQYYVLIVCVVAGYVFYDLEKEI